MAISAVRPGAAPRGLSDLRALLDKAGVYAGVFFGWWLGELQGLLPGWARRALAPSRRMLLVEIDGADAALSSLRDDRRQLLGKVSLTGAEMASGSALVRDMIGEQGRHKAAVVLCLPRSDALRWCFQAPSAVMAELGQALRYQIELETPFLVEEVLFDYRVKTAVPAARTVEVEVAVVPRARADRLLTPLDSLGLAPDRIDIEGGDDGPLPGFNLLPHDKGSGRLGASSPLNLGLALVVAGLLIAVLVLPIEQRRGLSEELDSRLAEVRVEADEALRLKAEVQQLVSESRFLADIKSSRPQRVVILEALSGLLPDHTSLSELKVRGNEVQIVGQSAAASSLVALVDGSPLFHDPKFRSSVTMDRRSERERFNLAFEVQEARAGVGEAKQ